MESFPIELVLYEPYACNDFFRPQDVKLFLGMLMPSKCFII